MDPSNDMSLMTLADADKFKEEVRTFLVRCEWTVGFLALEAHVSEIYLNDFLTGKMQSFIVQRAFRIRDIMRAQTSTSDTIDASDTIDSYFSRLHEAKKKVLEQSSQAKKQLQEEAVAREVAKKLKEQEDRKLATDMFHEKLSWFVSKLDDNAEQFERKCRFLPNLSIVNFENDPVKPNSITVNFRRGNGYSYDSTITAMAKEMFEQFLDDHNFTHARVYTGPGDDCISVQAA